MKQPRQALRTVFGFLLLAGVTVIKPFQASAELEVEWLHDVDITAAINNNVGQTLREEDKVESASLGVNYSLLSNIEMGNRQAVTLKLFLESERLEQLEDLSSETVGLQFVYRWQRTLGYLAPYYQLNTSIQLDKYGVEQRDSTVSRTQFFVTKRLADNLSVVAGAEHFQRDSDGSVFDMKHDRLFLSLDFVVTPFTTFYGSYGFRKGDISSTARIAECNGTPVLSIFRFITYAEERERDMAFEADQCGSWSTYRLDAETHSVALGINMGFGKSSALDFSVGYADAGAQGDISYQSTIFRISYLVRL
ncbi:MAG: hypothetical protein ACJAVI_004269 [Candidatus Azotimanducaceae bacterium]|jgi:hypothetical protein